MDAHVRDRWLPGRVELFVRGQRATMVLVGSLTFIAVVLFATAVGTPNTSKVPTGRFPTLDYAVARGPDGKPTLSLSERDLAKLRKHLTIPAHRKLEPGRAAWALFLPGLLGLLAGLSYFRYRRDGRASFIVDTQGIEHAWIGRIPWSRVRSLTVARFPWYVSEALVLLVDDPTPLRRKLPPIEVLRQRSRYPGDMSPGEIVLSLAPFDADARRLLSAARRLHEAASGPTAPAAAASGNDRQPAPTPQLPFTLGDRLSIAWVTLVALVGAAQLLAMTLFGHDLWLLP